MNCPPHILVVEDDQEIADVLVYLLNDDGYTVEHAIDGKAGLECFKNRQPDLVLLDLNLPRLSGDGLFGEMRKLAPTIPVIIASCLTSDSDRISRLEMGADDYINKPFNTGEVAARVRNLLRRAGNRNPGNNRITYGPYTLDTQAKGLTCFGKTVDLTRHEFRLLALLINHPSRIFERDAIISHLYSDAHPVTDRSVDSCVKRIRHKLKPFISSDSTPIRTVYGMGYQLAMVKEPNR